MLVIVLRYSQLVEVAVGILALGESEEKVRLRTGLPV